MFRLRTGHNRLGYHLYSKLRICRTEQFPCSTSSQTTEHLLQSSPLYEPPRKGIWPDHRPWLASSTAACRTYGVLPPSSRKQESPSGEREEEIGKLPNQYSGCDAKNFDVTDSDVTKMAKS